MEYSKLEGFISDKTINGKLYISFKTEANAEEALTELEENGYIGCLNDLNKKIVVID